MKILLSPMGTAGDIRPFIALHAALTDQGHEVVLVVPRNGEGICQTLGIDPIVLDFDYREFTRVIDSKPSIPQLIEILDQEIQAPFQTLAQLAPEADFLIGSARNYAIQPISERYGLPYYQVFHTPQVLESTQLTPWRFHRQNNPGWLNTLFWKVHNLKENKIGKRFVDKHRRALGLEPQADYAALLRQKILLVVNSRLAPVPADIRSEYLQTDYWFLDESDPLDPELLEFIGSGDPPLFFSFGSMLDRNPQQTVEIIESLMERLGMRAIVQKGWAGLGERVQSQRVRVVDAVPHHQLLPLTNGIIHHGGAGTTHTAARAGIPQIVLPQYGDQFYWGERVRALGIGSAPVPKSRLNLARLEQAILAIAQPGVRERAHRLGQELKQGEGIEAIAQRLLTDMESRLKQERRGHVDIKTR